MSEWKKVKLGDYIDVLSGFAFKSKDFSDSGIPVIKIKNVCPPYISLEDLSYVPNSIAFQNPRYILRKGDVLIAMTGSHINQIASVVGRVGRVRYDAITVLNQRVGKIVNKNEAKSSLDYIYYYLSQYEVKVELAQKAGGAANQANISPSDIKNLLFPYPPIGIQHRIATILSRYDSLIENYQKQIKLLEEAAQRLYKEWFVDLRFPGHENTNIIDGVPEGWEKKKLCEFTGITDGTHDSPKQVEIGLPLVTGRCIVDGNIDFSQAYNISEEDVIKINKRSAVEDGDILLSNIGTIGKVCRISKSGNYAVKNMIIFKPHDAIHSCFLHRFLTDNNTQMDFLQQAAGTSQKFVSLSFIRNTLILRPSDTILNLFYNHSEKYFNYVQSLQSQLRLLTEARDRLLPKLMSGEIEI